MECSECGKTVDEVFPVVKKVGKDWTGFKIVFVCKGCFAWYERKPAPQTR